MLTDCFVEEFFGPELLLRPLLYAKCMRMVEDTGLFTQATISGFEMSV
jgi:hypothetical protein